MSLTNTRFRNLLQSVPTVAVQGYWMDGITQYWNQASEQLYGYTAQEAIGRNILDLIIPSEMREGIRQAMHQMSETGRPIPASELSLVRKDGSRVAVLSSHAIVRIPGCATEFFCLDIDITERKQAEVQIREQLDELRRWYTATLGRETRVHELKHEVNELLVRAGQPPRYPSAETGREESWP